MSPLLSNRCISEDDAVIEDSIIGRKCRIMPGAKVKNSVLADGETVGRGESRDDRHKI